MKVLIIYDISQNASRLRIMNILFSKGFSRINLSGYIGNFNRNDFEPLLYSIRPFVKDERDSLYAVPVEESEVKRIRVVESSGIRGIEDRGVSTL